ncbi:MAG: DUF2239 family protein [Methyloceanibacter sp.]|nr:DUF2239 family protein [Methyloceanibacter sp.]
MDEQIRCTAFRGTTRIASGGVAEVALKAKAVIDADETAAILIFDDATSELVEVDFRGLPADVLTRLGLAPSRQDDAGGQADDARRGPGRPKLGVVAREVTLLPRHWDWLSRQPGGASVALRKLVEEARRGNDGKDRVRQSQEAAYRFMSAMAGNEVGFEEAARALFAGNEKRFQQLVEAWPADIGDHAKFLAAPALDVTPEFAVPRR